MIEEMMKLDTDSYVTEYNEVIAQISTICQIVTKNPKTVISN